MIIALVGRAGAGKNTFAAHMREFARVTEYSFAAPLKVQMMNLFDLTVEQVNGDFKDVVDKRYKQTPRQILKDFGMFARNIDPQVWVKRCLKEIAEFDRYNPGETLHVITDCRFYNEALAIKEAGGKVVRIFRETNVVSTHPSETEMDTPEFARLVNFKVYNNGNLDALCAQAKTLVDSLSQLPFNT